MSQAGQQRLLRVGARAAIVAGLLVGGIVAGLEILIGGVRSGSEARALVQNMLTPVSAMAQSIIGGLTTILALMLTLLSLSSRLDQNLSDSFYKRIRLLSLVSIVDIIAGILLLLVLSAPVGSAAKHAESLNPVLVSSAYYALIGLMALAAGLFVAVIVMLFNAVQTVIQAVALGERGSS